MASYTDKRNVLNKANLIEPIVRHRIQDSVFYKQHLYLTNESTIIPIIIEHVQYIGGTDSMGKPSPFLCCLLRLLELEPSSEIIMTAYLNQMGYNEFKYLTAITLCYIRLVHQSEDVYNTFDEYYKDLRKLRYKLKTPKFDGQELPIHFELTYVDQWVDDLLEKERVIDILLPRLIPRQVLVEREVVKPRVYFVEEPGQESESDYQSDSD